MSIDDLCLLLDHHWQHDDSRFIDGRQRLQLALGTLLCAGTAQRPSSIFAAYPTSSGAKVDQETANGVADKSLAAATQAQKLRRTKDGILYSDVKIEIKRYCEGQAEKQALLIYITCRHTKGEDRRPRPYVPSYLRMDRTDNDLGKSSGSGKSMCGC